MKGTYGLIVAGIALLSLPLMAQEETGDGSNAPNVPEITAKSSAESTSRIAALALRLRETVRRLSQECEAPAPAQ